MDEGDVESTKPRKYRLFAYRNFSSNFLYSVSVKPGLKGRLKSTRNNLRQFTPIYRPQYTNFLPILFLRMLSSILYTLPFNLALIRHRFLISKVEIKQVDKANKIEEPLYQRGVPSPYFTLVLQVINIRLFTVKLTLNRAKWTSAQDSKDSEAREARLLI